MKAKPAAEPTQPGELQMLGAPTPGDHSRVII